MTTKPVTILTGDPTIVVLAEQQLSNSGVLAMAEWVREHRPNCVPETGFNTMWDLLPHDDHDVPTRPRDVAEEEDVKVLRELHRAAGTPPLSHNEVLCEIAGRKCFDAETELLTHEGWMNIAEYVARNSVAPIATLNVDRDEIEFQSPAKPGFSKAHTGRMYNVESRAFSIRVTDDHDMWIRPPHGSWRFVAAKDIQHKHFAIRRAGRYAGRDQAVEFLGTTFDGAVRNPLAWAAFIGYAISEGTFVDGKKYGCGSRVTLYQSARQAEPILACLDTLGIEPYVKTDPRSGVLHIVVNDTAITSTLMEAVGTTAETKRLPACVFTWSPGMRAALLDALMYGDGTSDKHRVYSTVSPRLADDVQRLIVLSGRPGTISVVAPNNAGRYPTSFAGNFPVYRVREGARDVGEVSVEKHVTYSDVVDEQVYCVTIPNRILVLRRRNKVFMASNCYDSFADAAGKKTNREYFEHIVSMDPMHASIMYHAKMTFFFAGVSRKFSHQFIRNYVGSDRDEEGSPSQESTRFTHHYGWYVMPPADVSSAEEDRFAGESQRNYDDYCAYIERRVEAYTAMRGKAPTGGDRKDIYEAAAGRLSMSAETSFVWTTNPMALRKFLKERCHGAADAEIFRFAKVLARICFARWPNLFLGKDLDGVRRELEAA
jgi:thymidylate synthase ThyX